MDTTRACCSAALTVESANFCPTCGTRLPRAVSLREVLDRHQLHRGHDYRAEVRDASGILVGVRMLGLDGDAVHRLREELPGYVITERSRRVATGPGLGVDWVRVDVDLASD